MEHALTQGRPCGKLAGCAAYSRNGRRGRAARLALVVVAAAVVIAVVVAVVEHALAKGRLCWLPDCAGSRGRTRLAVTVDVVDAPVAVVAVVEHAPAKGRLCWLAGSAGTRRSRSARKWTRWLAVSGLVFIARHAPQLAHGRLRASLPRRRRARVQHAMQYFLWASCKRWLCRRGVLDVVSGRFSAHVQHAVPAGGVRAVALHGVDCVFGTCLALG